VRKEKTMKKSILTIAATALLVGGLASCGPTSNPTDPSAGPSVPAGDTLEIQFWSTFNKDFHDQIEVHINEFERIILENEGVKIDFKFSQQGGYDDLATKVSQGFTSGIYPTIAVAYPDHVADWLNRVPENVANIESLINDPEIGFGKDKIADLHDDYSLEEGYVSAFIEEGSKYALPGTYSFPFLKSTEIMAYNKILVESITIPELNNGYPLNKKFMENITWDEFVKILEYIKANNEGEDGFNVEWPAYYDSDSNLFITKMMQNNIPFIANAENSADKVLFNNDAAKAEVQALKDLYDDGLIMTKGVNNGQYGSNYFSKSEVVFSISSSGGAGYMDLGGDVPVEVVKVPYDNAPSYVSQGPTLCFLNHNNDAKNDLKIKYAYRLVKYLTTAEVNAQCAVNSGGYIPVNNYSYSTAQYDHFLYSETNEYNVLSINARCVIESVNGAYYNLPSFKGSANIRDGVGGIITQVLAGTKSIDDAFDLAYNDAILACR
jgi:maltose-binding protein MalE